MPYGQYNVSGKGDGIGLVLEVLPRHLHGKGRYDVDRPRHASASAPSLDPLTCIATSSYFSPSSSLAAMTAAL